ncbi:MAG: hypothetical protein AAF804_02270, partial [Bacteroidota bacterium]
MRYLILQHPGHNRVYFKASEALALAELTLIANRLSTEAEQPKALELAGIRYFYLETDSALLPEDLYLLWRFSFFFALFELDGDIDQGLFRPVLVPSTHYVDPKISSLLKYSGKTNELFTKLMLNVAWLASDFTQEEHLQLLDPVAGRGTTLYEAVIHGFDAYGIDVEKKAIHEAAVFFKKYLEQERLKHLSDKRIIHRNENGQTIQIQEFKYARNKEEFKREGGSKQLGLIVGEAQQTLAYFKKPRFHLLVGDLPYGIQHGSRHQQGQSRNPVDFLLACG